MSIEDLFSAPQPTKIGNIFLDCHIRESHQLRSRVTDNPVEDGSTISDHIIPEPREVTIEGIVTNSPLSNTVSGFLVRNARGTVDQDGRATGRGLNFAQLAFQELERIHAARELVTIVGKLKVYTGMAMVDAPVLKDSTFDEIRIVAVFREVKKATLRTALFTPTRNETGQGTRSKGKQTGPEGPTPVKRRVSTLRKIAEGNGLLDAPGAL